MFTCKKCNQDFNRKDTLITHLKRKTSCNPESDINTTTLIQELTKKECAHICVYCKKGFTQSSNLSRHKKTCPKAPENKDIFELKQRIKKLELESKQSKRISVSNYNNNNNNNNNNNTNIQINAFGNENIDYLVQNPNFQNWFIKCFKTKINGLCEYMCKKHLNDKHPENTNIRKLIKNDPFIDIYDGKEWKAKYKSDVLDNVFLCIYRDYARFIEEALDQDGLIKKQWLDNFMIEAGEALNYDFYCSKYDYDHVLSETEKNKIKKNIYNLACEYIYRHSKL